MALTILLMLLFSLLLLISGWRNQYFLLFAAMVLAMCVAMLSLISELSRISNYLVPANYLIGSLETRLYRLCHSSFRISLSILMLLRNVGIVVYFAALVCFVHSFYNNVRLDGNAVSERMRWFRYALLTGFPILFFVFYHPDTAFWIFIRFHMLEGTAARQAFSVSVETAHKVMTFCTLLYLCYPVYFLVRNHQANRMTFLSGLLVRLAFALAVLNVSFFIMFFIGEFQPSVASVLDYGFWRFRVSTQIPVFYTTSLPMVTFAVLVIVFAFIVRLHADYVLNFFKSRGIRKNLSALYANVRNVMHSEKNMMFTIRILAEEAQFAEDEETRRAKLDRIISLCNNNLEEMTRTLNNVHDMKLSAMRHDFLEAIEGAIRAHPLPDHVMLVRDYQMETLPLRFDMYHMTEAIGNVLRNSVDALTVARPENPTIRLSVSTSNSWIYFSVWDNGCGIPKNLIRKVERPYVSTKSRKNSWGIGLSYVFNVIRAHYGQFRIHSRQGEYTLVEILLPRESGKEKKR